MTDEKTSAAPRRLAREDDAPPGMQEELPAYSPPSKNPLNAQIPLAQQLQAAGGSWGDVKRQFPPEFNLYNASIVGRSFQLGEHQNAPIYLVATHAGWSGQPAVVLHTSTSSKSPPLATANYKTFGSDATIVLPPLNPKLGPSEKLLKSGMFIRTFSFSVEVPAGPDGQLRSESFEWRHSKSGDVATLGSVWGRGWKLVRMGGGVAAGSDVVAVFTAGPLSLTKKFCFKFVGAGEDGSLGERWAVMAVISAIAIWEKERRRRNNSGAAAAGAASA